MSYCASASQLASQMIACIAPASHKTLRLLCFSLALEGKNKQDGLMVYNCICNYHFKTTLQYKLAHCPLYHLCSASQAKHKPSFFSHHVARFQSRMCWKQCDVPLKMICSACKHSDQCLEPCLDIRYVVGRRTCPSQSWSPIQLANIL